MKYEIEYPLGCKESSAYLASTGCGSGWNDGLVPDNLIGLDISEACKIHDYCYTVGVNKKDKVKADKLFYRNLKNIVYSDNKLILRTTRLALAYAYYKFVSDFGDSYFWEGKPKPKHKTLFEKLMFWK